MTPGPALSESGPAAVPTPSGEVEPEPELRSDQEISDDGLASAVASRGTACDSPLHGNGALRTGAFFDWAGYDWAGPQADHPRINELDRETEEGPADEEVPSR